MLFFEHGSRVKFEGFNLQAALQHSAEARWDLGLAAYLNPTDTPLTQDGLYVPFAYASNANAKNIPENALAADGKPEGYVYTFAVDAKPEEFAHLDGWVCHFVRQEDKDKVAAALRKRLKEQSLSEEEIEERVQYVLQEPRRRDKTEIALLHCPYSSDHLASRIAAVLDPSVSDNIKALPPEAKEGGKNEDPAYTTIIKDKKSQREVLDLKLGTEFLQKDCGFKGVYLDGYVAAVFDDRIIQAIRRTSLSKWRELRNQLARGLEKADKTHPSWTLSNDLLKRMQTGLVSSVYETLSSLKELGKLNPAAFGEFEKIDMGKENLYQQASKMPVTAEKSCVLPPLSRQQLSASAKETFKQPFPLPTRPQPSQPYQRIQ